MDLKPSMPTPKVIGLYGISGSGKTFMIDQLRQKLGEECFEFYDGSAVIDNVAPGGLAQFKGFSDAEKTYWRESAIKSVRLTCAERGKVGIVAGHFMFWPEGHPNGSHVVTQEDLNTYTHILYLDIPAEVVVQRCANDQSRSRPRQSVDHMRKWQASEKLELSQLCREHNMLFSLVTPGPSALRRVMEMLEDFRQHSEEHNNVLAQRLLDGTIAAKSGQLQTMLVLDADRTLAAQDSGALFWKKFSDAGMPLREQSPLKTIFSSPLQYSYTAFRQAVLLYEDSLSDQDFDVLCDEVASVITLYPEFASLLRQISTYEHVGAVVMTCGLRRIWVKVLEKYDLSESIKVIGGGRIADDFVIYPELKSILVQRLRNVHKLYVWAFGDSPMDLGMLLDAHQAIVVVGEEGDRSTTMDVQLLRAINFDGLEARQALLPRNVSPRLDITKIPLIELRDPTFFESIICPRQNGDSRFRLLHATEKNAAKVLMTPMRDAKIVGPTLREAHRQVGRYLAAEYLTHVIGIERCLIQHVQGGETDGFRLQNERSTLIVALMRGGEPMAQGVNDLFPSASFLHAFHSTDIKEYHLEGQQNVVLVDSVINSGKTIVEFAKHIHQLNGNIRVLIVAGVVQEQSVSENGPVRKLGLFMSLSLAALRLSKNKYSGQGGTDTGNRLFNTTHLA